MTIWRLSAIFAIAKTANWQMYHRKLLNFRISGNFYGRRVIAPTRDCTHFLKSVLYLFLCIKLFILLQNFFLYLIEYIRGCNRNFNRPRRPRIKCKENGYTPLWVQYRWNQFLCGLSIIWKIYQIKGSKDLATSWQIWLWHIWQWRQFELLNDTLTLQCI